MGRRRSRSQVDPRASPLPPRVVGQYIGQRWRGLEVIRRWPVVRSKRAQEAIDPARAWLYIMNVCWKYTHPDVRAVYEEMSRGKLYTARDLWFAMMTGSVFAITTDDGRLIVPIYAVEKVSQSLDALGWSLGSLLVRGEHFWQPLSPGPNGTFLMSLGPDQLPQWRPVPKTGLQVWWELETYAPQSSEFEFFRVGRAGSSVDWRSWGVEIRSAAGMGTNPTVLLRKGTLGAAFTLVVGFVPFFTKTGDQFVGGITLYPPGSTNAISFDVMLDRVAYRRYYNNYALEERVMGIPYEPVAGVPIFLRLESRSGVWTLSAGITGRTWLVLLSRAHEHISPPWRWGVIVDARNASAAHVLHFFHYQVSAS